MKKPLAKTLAGVAIGTVVAVAYLVIPFHRFFEYPEGERGALMAAQASDPAFKSRDAVVVELFTSQSCFSCPMAEAILRDLSARPDVATFEFHVHYWNSLVYGAKGQWQDVFSKKEWTQRQADYNQSLFNTDHIYTPQVIIDGKWQEAGNREGALVDAIAKAAKARTPAPEISIRYDQGRLTASVPENAGTLMLVTFVRRAVTRVDAGENAGKTLASYNIVTDLFPIDRDTPTPLAIREGESCAVLLKEKDAPTLKAAAFCPL